MGGNTSCEQDPTTEQLQSRIDSLSNENDTLRRQLQGGGDCSVIKGREEQCQSQKQTCEQKLTYLKSSCVHRDTHAPKRGGR